MGFVKLEQQGNVGILSIDRPEALNALNSQVLTDLDAALDQVEADESIYVVILTGAGRAFVAGADIAEMKEFSSVDGKRFGVRGGGVFLKLENLSKPVTVPTRMRGTKQMTRLQKLPFAAPSE